MIISTVFISPLPVSGVVPAADRPAQKRPRDNAALAEAREEHLEVSLNGVSRGVYAFDVRADGVWAARSTLQEMGVTLPPTGPSPLNLMAFEGMTVDYTAAVQRLALTVRDDQAQLPRAVFSQQETQTYPGSSGKGVLFNYDAFATHSNSANALSLFNELRAFGPLGTVSNTALSHFNDAAPSRHETVRLDTAFSTSWQDNMVTLRAGDALTGAVSWSRATRFGGVQLARNFDLNPYLVNSPLVEFLGSTVTPSNVDLLIDGVKQYSTSVPPGPFAITALPRINGYGNAQIVMTDALGQVRTVDIPVFFTPSVLNAGLADWSLDAGKVRLNYGKNTFDYSDEPLLSSALRYGLTPTITLENQMEYSAGLFKKGLGMVVIPHPSLGVFSGSYAQSRHHERTGEQKGVGYQWSNRYFNVGGSLLRADPDYRDIASLYGATLNAKSQQLFLGFSLGATGSFSVSHITQTPVERGTTRFVNVSWLKNLGENVSLNLWVNRNLNDREEYTVSLGMSVALPERTRASASTNVRKKGVVNALSATHTAPSDGGLGWRTRAVSEKGEYSAQADIEYMTQRARLTASATTRSDLSMGASGAVVVMNGQGFMTKPLNDAFAVVSTHGVSDVPVLLENRLIGKTDAEGFLLVSPLYSYQKNQLSIDSLDLPPGYTIPNTKTVAVPNDRTGSYVEFPIKPAYAATVELVNARGEALPIGTEVFIKGQRQSYRVGFGGEVYLEGLTDNPDIEAHLPKENPRAGTGAVCYARIAYRAEKDSIVHVARTVCTPAK